LDQSETHLDAIRLTSDIVSAYVGNNSIPSGELPNLINLVFTSLTGLATPPEPVVVLPEPAVPIRKSVTPDFIVCLEDGKPLKILKRHLRTAHNMSLEEYRRRWGLPTDYPMIAPNYTKTRQALALRNGLGRNRGKAATVLVAPKPGRKGPRQTRG
jgi:predicted transcriptional regulator